MPPPLRPGAPDLLKQLPPPRRILKPDPPRVSSILPASQPAGNLATQRLATANTLRAADTPMQDDLLRFGQQEARDLQTVRPGPGHDQPKSSVKITANENPDTQVRDIYYEFLGEAKGQRGSITSETLVHLHYDPGDPDQMFQQVIDGIPVADPYGAKVYPITITYTRTIAYADDYGRTLDVNLTANVWFRHDAWRRASAQHPDLTLDSLEQFEGSAGHLAVNIHGKGDLSRMIDEDFPGMPEEIKKEMLRDTSISYFGAVSVDAYSLRFLCGDAASALKNSQGGFTIHYSDVPGNFLYPAMTAGQQYDGIRAYLESRDRVRVQQWQAEIADRLANPATLVSGPLVRGEPDEPGFLDHLIAAIAGVWHSLPASVRGGLKAIGKAVGAIAAIVVVAAIVVALAPVELTIGAVALAIGAVMLIGSFFHSIYVRSVESVDTGSGNPLSVFFISIGDALGITAVIEGYTNESVLSGRSLNLDEEGQWERGVGGGIQVVLSILGLRTAAKGSPPARLPAEPPARPATAPELPPPTGEPARPPLFDDLRPSEIDAAFEGADSPNVTGGATRPRIGDRPVPTQQRRRMDLEDIPRRIGETARQALARVNRLIGHRLNEFPAIRDAWARARQQVLAEHGPLTRDNYAALYDAARRQFWRNVREDPAALQEFTDAGFEFPAGETTAPVLEGTGNLAAQERRISLDHDAPKAQGDNWQYALDADNLTMEFHNPNSYRETVQVRHPALRE